MLGASFGAEWAGVCPALFMRLCMLGPRVRDGSNGAGLPPITGVPCSSEGQALKDRAPRRLLALTIQSEGEAFQGGEVAYAGSKKRSSCLEYAAAKGRFQPSYMGGKLEAESTPAFAFAGDTCGGLNKEEFLGMLPVTRFDLAPRGSLNLSVLREVRRIFDLFASNNRRNRENRMRKA